MKGLDLPAYSQPEFNQKLDSFLFNVLDSHHILTNARSKCCSSGMIKAGIRREAWLRVAQENKTKLNLSMVENLIDRQSNSLALTTFSKEVEEAMKKNGDYKEAEFCNLLREWYSAEDDCGISSMDRTRKRFALREWLLQDVNFREFPPPGAYVKGMPVIMYEGLLTSIERKTQLYEFVKCGTYNQRAVTTRDVENFFGTFNELDPQGHRVVSPDDLPHVMQTATDILTESRNPKRYFFDLFICSTIHNKLNICGPMLIQCLQDPVNISNFKAGSHLRQAIKHT